MDISGRRNYTSTIVEMEIKLKCISLDVQVMIAAHRSNCVSWKDNWTYPVDNSRGSKM